MHFLPDLDMERVEAPEVDEDDDITPEVSKHLRYDSKHERVAWLDWFEERPECPGEGAGEPVFVLVDDHETLHFFNFVAEHIHQLLHKLCVSLILE